MGAGSITIHHKLGRDAAKARFVQGLASMRAQFGSLLSSADETWSGPYDVRFSVGYLGVKASGRVIITDTTIEISTKLPLVLRPFRSKVIGYIQSEGSAYFVKAA